MKRRRCSPRCTWRDLGSLPDPPLTVFQRGGARGGRGFHRPRPARPNAALAFGVAGAPLPRVATGVPAAHTSACFLRGGSLLLPESRALIVREVQGKRSRVTFVASRAACERVRHAPVPKLLQLHAFVPELKRQPHVRRVGQSVAGTVHPVVPHVHEVWSAAVGLVGELHHERGLAVEAGAVARWVAQIHPLRVVQRGAGRAEQH
mmetsp:Transcript_45708/g.92272  ORF Transcript_45708/g.92272 Transcript_45708/m.92272 type:complete len:205 (-) Transcript_45708:172-786(-)